MKLSTMLQNLGSLRPDDWLSPPFLFYVVRVTPEIGEHAPKIINSESKIWRYIDDGATAFGAHSISWEFHLGINLVESDT